MTAYPLPRLALFGVRDMPPSHMLLHSTAFIVLHTDRFCLRSDSIRRGDR